VNSNEDESADMLWSVDDCLEWLLLDEDENRLEAGLERPDEVAEVEGERRHLGESRISRLIGPASLMSAAMLNCFCFFTPSAL
jgi:hypothetical protein